MKKFTVRLENGVHDVYLDGFIRTGVDSVMSIRNIAVYWNTKNVLSGINDTVTLTALSGAKTVLLFDEGYWTFDMIRRFVVDDGIKLRKNMYDNKCEMEASAKTDHIDLGRFGQLLGFDTARRIQSGTSGIPANDVNINRGLEYVTIGCNAVNASQNFDVHGNKSTTIATISVTSEQRLNWTVTYYDVNSSVPMTNGDHSALRFDIGTNIVHDVDLTVLFELYITP